MGTGLLFICPLLSVTAVCVWVTTIRSGTRIGDFETDFVKVSGLDPKFVSVGEAAASVDTSDEEPIVINQL